ncbi:ribosomal protein L22/L17 [Chytridium lagenaria]|nr:ribosomal protein L22/L17 [Chytridium lagenaria]
MSLIEGALKEASESKAGQINPSERKSLTFKSPNFRISPWKTNLVAKVCRGLPLKEAITQMKFSKKRAGTKVLSLLTRVAASLENNYNSQSNNWVIKQCWVGKGSYLKRMNIQGRGKLGIMHHPSSHVKVVIEELPQGQTSETATQKAARLELEKLLYVQLKEDKLPFAPPPPWSRKPYKYITSSKWSSQRPK